jgi:hypothetical protein
MQQLLQYHPYTHLLPHTVHQVWPSDTVGEPGEVLNLCSSHELPAAPVLQALKDNRLQVCTRSIDCCCVASRPRANNDHVLNICRGSSMLASMSCVLICGVAGSAATPAQELQARKPRYY